MGVQGTKIPAIIRGIVAICCYGVQNYCASTAVALFSFIPLFVTAGTVVLFGEKLVNPADIVDRVDNTLLTLIAAITFFAATAGINLAANFIPPAYYIANLNPEKISAKTGGLITAGTAFFIGAFCAVCCTWASTRAPKHRQGRSADVTPSRRRRAGKP